MSYSNLSFYINVTSLSFERIPGSESSRKRGQPSGQSETDSSGRVKDQ